MFRIFRPKVSAAPKKPKKSIYFRKYWNLIKPFVKKVAWVAVSFLGLTGLYFSQESWLDKLDRTPIRAYSLTHTPQFTIDSDIRETLAKEPALKGYFAQNIEEIVQKLEQISWVRAAIVHKIWPDKLSITLFEYQPIAVWNNIYYLSEQGTVFSLPADRFKDKANLPVLFGPDREGKKVFEAWHTMGKELKARNLTLKAVAIDERGSWKITLANDIELRLGRGEWLKKIDRFVTLYPEIEIPEGKRLAYVDLRYEHGAAVGFAVKH